MKSIRERIAAIEAGGTKWVCAIGDNEGNVFEEISIPTKTPELTMPSVVEALFLLEKNHGKFHSLGVGTFGPIMLDSSSEKYGCYLNTPKEGWGGFDLIGALRQGLGNSLKISIDTDVNTAVLAESKLGAARGLNTVCYVTVGTGIGGGVIVDGQLLHGRMHPEIGHLLVEESRCEPTPGFSVCPFHKNCIEGKASGTAINKRWNIRAQDLDEGHLAWDLEAEYLAQLCVTLTAMYSPEMIVFGGGVSNFTALFPKIRKKFRELAGGYWGLPDLESYIQKTQLNDRAGLRGALML